MGIVGTGGRIFGGSGGHGFLKMWPNFFNQGWSFGNDGFGIDGCLYPGQKKAEVQTADENLSFPVGPKVWVLSDFERKLILEASNPL